MVFRQGKQEQVQEEDEDGLNITSGDDDDEDEGEPQALFAKGQPCDMCGQPGRLGIDPTARAQYDGVPALVCFGCAPAALKEAYAGVEGIAIIVEPFDDYSAHYYYRLDELPAYQFVRDDVEAVSWLLLTIGDACARCGEQSHVAWLTRDFVDAKLPENKPLFRNMDAEIEHLCNNCAAEALAASYASLNLPLITAEVPRAAMGIVMPTAD